MVHFLRHSERMRLQVISRSVPRGGVLQVLDVGCGVGELSELLANRGLKPGGCFIVSTPYRERLQYTLCIHCNKKTPVNAHLHSFDDTALVNMLHKAGFSIERVSKISNKITERLGIPGLTFFLPYSIWRFIDGCFCRLFGNQSFIVIRAKRGE